MTSDLFRELRRSETKFKPSMSRRLLLCLVEVLLSLADQLVRFLSTDFLLERASSSSKHETAGIGKALRTV